jgi:hypothetical protein
MSTTTVKKKHINELTAEFAVYWEPLFSEMGIENPLFFAKLCYNSNEFGPTQVETLRFYGEQLSKNQDVYVELFDWDDKSYPDGKRTLYKFKNNLDWRENPQDYVEVTRKKDGSLLPYPSYAFKLSTLEKVNETDLKYIAPELNTKISNESDLELPKFGEIDNDIFDDNYVEKDDNHYAQMTIRDIYCIVQNTPMSNKKWLNNLIKEGKQWQVQQK